MRARWLLVGCILLCAGCAMRLDVEVVFDRDGGGRLEVALSADGELLEQARAAGADPLGDLAATGEALGRGWRVSDTTTDDGDRTVALSTGFDDPGSFSELTRQMAEALAAPEVQLLSPLSVAVDADRLVVDGAAGVQPTEAVAELGLTPDQVVALLREGAFTYEVRVGLPGEVIETNGIRREDGMVAWTIEPGERVALSAVGHRPDPPVWPLVAGALVGVTLAGLLLLRAASRRRR